MLKFGIAKKDYDPSKKKAAKEPEMAAVSEETKTLIKTKLKERLKFSKEKVMNRKVVSTTTKPKIETDPKIEEIKTPYTPTPKVGVFGDLTERVDPNDENIMKAKKTLARLLEKEGINPVQNSFFE